MIKTSSVQNNIKVENVTKIIQINIFYMLPLVRFGILPQILL